MSREILYDVGGACPHCNRMLLAAGAHYCYVVNLIITSTVVKGKRKIFYQSAKWRVAKVCHDIAMTDPSDCAVVADACAAAIREAMK